MIKNIQNLMSAGARPRIHNGFILLPVSNESQIEVYGGTAKFSPGIRSPIHDHNYGFRSKILCGRLRDIRYKPRFHAGGKYLISELIIMDETAFSLEPRDRMVPCDMVATDSHSYGRGDVYEMEEGLWHKAFARDLTMVFTMKNYINHYSGQNIAAAKNKAGGIGKHKPVDVEVQDLWDSVFEAAKKVEEGKKSLT